MAKLNLKIRIEPEFTLNLDEEEARALYALTVYGIDNFLNFFYSTLGRAYLEKHEKGLRSLFAEINDKFPNQFHTIGLIDSKLHSQ